MCLRNRLGQSEPFKSFKLNSCPVLLQFAIFLTLIMLVEVAVAIAGYVFRDQVSREQGEPVSGCSGNLGPEVLFSATHVSTLR